MRLHFCVLFITLCEHILSCTSIESMNNDFGTLLAPVVFKIDLFVQDNTITMTDIGDYNASDSLLPGRGYTPDYGINQSVSGSNSWEASEKLPRPSAVNTAIKSVGRGERVWRVVMCSMIACLASLVSGMMLGFSSPALTQLQFNVLKEDQINSTDIKYSLFGVCVQYMLRTTALIIST